MRARMLIICMHASFGFLTPYVSKKKREEMNILVVGS